jgi:hypothetical protein
MMGYIAFDSFLFVSYEFRILFCCDTMSDDDLFIIYCISHTNPIEFNRSIRSLGSVFRL